MKELKIMVVTLIFVVGFLVSGGIAKVEAGILPGEYLGELCWDHLGDIYVLGVTHMGDNHFLVAGSVTNPLFPGFTVPVNGNAEIVGGQILITLNASGAGPAAVIASTAHVILDPATLVGTIEFLDLFHDPLDPNPFSAFAFHDGPNPIVPFPCP